MKRIVNIWHLLVAVLFAAFAIVQFNDPDPYIWVFIYLVVACIATFAAFGNYNRRITGIALVISSIWAVYYIPGFITWIRNGMPSIVSEMKAESPHIELVREFFGILIVVVTLLFYFRFSKIRKV